MLGLAVHEYDPLVRGEPPPELARRYEPSGPAAENDCAAGKRACAARSKLLASGPLVQLPDRIREARLVELVFRENDRPVGPDEDAPGNPAVGEGAEERPVRIRDDRELEREFFLPGPAGLLGLERPDVDDLEPVSREAFVEVLDGGRLPPTALSSCFPEDEQ